MVASIAAAVPDVILLLKQINILPGTWYADECFFSSVPGKVSSIPSKFYFRVLLAFQPYGKTLIILFILQDIKGETTQQKRKEHTGTSDALLERGLACFWL